MQYPRLTLLIDYKAEEGRRMSSKANSSGEIFTISISYNVADWWTIILLK